MPAASAQHERTHPFELPANFLAVCARRLHGDLAMGLNPVEGFDCGADNSFCISVVDEWRVMRGRALADEEQSEA